MPTIASILPSALSVVAAATIFVLMFHLGMTVAPEQYLRAWRFPGLMLRGLFCAIVAVPVVVIIVARAFELSREAEIGMVLMAIAPGAPVALRRALDAGGHRAFAPALQVSMAVLVVVTIPVSVAALDEVYAGSASVAPLQLAGQVFLGQVFPLGLGMVARRGAGARIEAIEPLLARLTVALLVALVALLLPQVWEPLAGAGIRVTLAIVLATLCALGLGHALGGPASSTRTALAVCSAARNTGLAMLVASINHASPATEATMLAYFAISALTVTPYAAWRRRIAGAVEGGADDGMPAQKTNLP